MQPAFAMLGPKNCSELTFPTTIMSPSPVCQLLLRSQKIGALVQIPMMQPALRLLSLPNIRLRYPLILPLQKRRRILAKAHLETTIIALLKAPYAMLAEIPAGRKDGTYFVLNNTDNINKRKGGDRSDFWDDLRSLAECRFTRSPGSSVG